QQADDRREDRPADEDVGNAHWDSVPSAAAASPGPAGAFSPLRSIVLSIATGVPLESRFWPAVTTLSPGATPLRTSACAPTRRPTLMKDWRTSSAPSSLPSFSRTI